MKNCSILLFLALLLPVPPVSGQYYDTGEDPSSLKWLQIKTKRFTVIYPQSFGEEGINYARSLDNSYSKLSSLFSVKKLRMPVIIHNYTSFSNGYVAWSPRRIELFPTPEQNTIPLDPVEQLTTHELAHALQMYSLKKGFSNFMTVPFGEQFTGFIAVMVPMWFMEGDAVFAESALSSSGRGRSPSFMKQLKAIELEKNTRYSYDKMLNGSYRTFTPDEYELGYQMVTWSSAKYSTGIWNSALEYTAKHPYTLNPVNLSLRKTAGLTKAKLYSETIDSLKILWQKDESRSKASLYEAVNPGKKREYINYYSPVLVGEDSLVAIKTSFYYPPSFVLINNREKSEKSIFIPGYIYPWFLSGRNGKIVWVENHPDPRWDNRDYSVVKIMDIRLNKTVQLSYRSRFMAASLSPDCRLIAASENSIDNNNSLVIIDALNGDVINRIAIPGNKYAQRPQWSASGNEITIISLAREGEGIMSYSLRNQQWKTLIEDGRNDLQSSFLRNDSLFYVSSASGTDNIYLLSPDGNTSMLTNSRFGAYDLFAAGRMIYFSDYTFSGNNISRIDIEKATFIPVASSKSAFLINRFDTLKYRSPEGPATDYIPKPYRKWQHLFRFHSWMPFYADIQEIQTDPASIRPGFTLLSQNNLSTLITSLGYEYSDRRNLFHSRITWKGWFPVIESQLDYGAAPSVLKLRRNIPNPTNLQPALGLINTVSIPLTFSSGKFTQFLLTSLSSSYYNEYIYLNTTGNFDYGQMLVKGRIYLSNFFNQAIRDIFPRWAQVIDYNYTFAPFDRNIYGPESTLKSAIYIPGFLRNHGIRLRFEAESQKPQILLLYNGASFPRGYSNIISQDLKFYSADYTMPLLYPDLNIPGFLYIKRIRGDIFYDHARAARNTYIYADTTVYHNDTEIFKSFGFELVSDFYLLRIPFTISGGVQVAWKNFATPPYFEFILNFDIYGMKIGNRRLKRTM